MLRQFSTRRIILTVAVDWLGTLLALLLASWLRARLLLLSPSITSALAAYEFPTGLAWYPSILKPQVYLLVAGIWPFFLVLLGAYDGSRNATLKAELLNVFAAVGVASLTLASTLFFTFRTTSRLLAVIFFVLSLAVLWGVRIALWAYRLQLNPQPRLSRRQMLVVGAGPAGRAAVEQLRRYAWADVNLVGYVDDDPAKQGQKFEGLAVLGGTDCIAELVSEHYVQDAIVALPLRAHERLVEVCQILQQRGVHVHVIPDLFALSFPGASLEGFGGIPVIDLGLPGIYGWRRVSKRAFDIVVSALVLLLLSPVLLLVALAIRLESAGPVLYRQRRIGENGRPFTMLKFRSMVVNADPELHQAHVARLIQDNISLEPAAAAPGGPANGPATLKLARDPRVTRVGALIRKTSLDELPQLFNVLRGDMSLVGPRPPIAYEVALYQDWHKRRLSAPPGMTGLWQVRGRNRVSFDEMVRMDLDYIEHQSFWLDLLLLNSNPPGRRWRPWGGLSPTPEEVLIRKLKVGVVGCGYWGPKLARNLHELPETELAWVADFQPERLAHMQALYPEVRATGKYADILAADIDAVVLATPVSTHYALAMQALRAGKHVLIEKPIAATVAEAEDIAETAERLGLVAMVGHTFQYNPAVNVVRDLVQGNELGQVYYVSGTRVNLGLFQPDINVMWDLGPHDISILLHVLGVDPLWASASGESYVQKERGIHDMVSLALYFPSGVIATLRLSWLDPVKTRLITIVGSQKMLVYDDIADNKVILFDKGVSVPAYSDTLEEFHLSYRHGPELVVPYDWVEPLRAECQAFAQAIHTGQPPHSDARMGVKVVRVLEAAQRSLSNGGGRETTGL